MEYFKQTLHAMLQTLHCQCESDRSGLVNKATTVVVCRGFSNLAQMYKAKTDLKEHFYFTSMMNVNTECRKMVDKKLKDAPLVSQLKSGE